MALHLPENPTGEQFEDLLAAALRAHGYFTESRVRLRKRKHEVLELDVLATPLGGGPESIFEAKKETPSFETIFKRALTSSARHGFKPATGASHDPVAALVLCAPGPAAFTIVHGRVVVREGHLVTLDLPVALEQHRRHARRLAGG